MKAQEREESAPTQAGTVVSDVTRARVVGFPNGTLQTSFPDMKSIEKFSISFSIGRFQEPVQYDQDYYHEWGPLFQSLRRFLTNYRGEFEIKIGDRRLHFNWVCPRWSPENQGMEAAKRLN